MRSWPRTGQAPRQWRAKPNRDWRLESLWQWSSSPMHPRKMPPTEVMEASRVKGAAQVVYIDRPSCRAPSVGLSLRERKSLTHARLTTRPARMAGLYCEDALAYTHLL